MGLTKAVTVLEVGCGPGWNLLALRCVDMPGPFVRGVDVNQVAVDEARAEGLDVQRLPAADAALRMGPSFDLVFTSGMLIHVAPQDLQKVMASIIGATSRYVLAIEYDAPEEQEIEYRGKPALLWKRPYGELYQAQGLKPVATGPAGEDFDNCTFWLMEKP